MTDASPTIRYLPADDVIATMGEFGRRRVLELTSAQIVVLAVMGGAFITAGALFSSLLAVGVGAEGLVLLVEGFGFSAGFFFVVLSEAALFTEANVVLPAVLLGRRASIRRVLRFWGLAIAGNLLGALLIGWLVRVAQVYPESVEQVIDEVVARKLSYQATGGAGSWFRLVLSGVLANWLVGMAAFFATMGRTIIGKYIPVFLAVSLFVAANFQHAPANMGFFSLAIAGGADLSWTTALGWSLIPAGVGNVIGGSLLVALPFWYAFRQD